MLSKVSILSTHGLSCYRKAARVDVTGKEAFFVRDNSAPIRWKGIFVPEKKVQDLVHQKVGQYPDLLDFLYERFNIFSSGSMLPDQKQLISLLRKAVKENLVSFM